MEILGAGLKWTLFKFCYVFFVQVCLGLVLFVCVFRVNVMIIGVRSDSVMGTWFMVRIGEVRFKLRRIYFYFFLHQWEAGQGEKAPHCLSLK